MGIYFDARSRRKEPRYRFSTPVQVSIDALKVTGATVDLSKRGLSLLLDTPLDVKANDQVWVDYLELKLYDKSLPLDKAPTKWCVSVLKDAVYNWLLRRIYKPSKPLLSLIASLNTTKTNY